MIVAMKARSNLKQPILTMLALLIPVAIFIAAAPTNSPNINSLKPAPPIPVAFVISEGAVVIDFCGPWEVFRDVVLPSGDHPFRLYTISDKTAPITAGGGMKIVPDYTFANAPAPKAIVIPAQSEPSAAVLDWIRQSTKNTDVTMSVCTGAFVLAKTGLLSGKSAVTHHTAFKHFAMQFPDIQLKRGARFVEDANLATAGGLSSGIDLVGPLQVFARAAEIFGKENPGSRPIYSLEVVSASSQKSVMTNCGLRITAHKTFREVRGEIDTLLVAGGDAIEKDEINIEIV